MWLLSPQMIILKIILTTFSWSGAAQCGLWGWHCAIPRCQLGHYCGNTIFLATMSIVHSLSTPYYNITLLGGDFYTLPSRWSGASVPASGAQSTLTPLGRRIENWSENDVNNSRFQILNNFHAQAREAVVLKHGEIPTVRKPVACPQVRPHEQKVDLASGSALKKSSNSLWSLGPSVLGGLLGPATVGL